MQIPRKMSAQNVMASISRTLGTRHSTAAEGPSGKSAGAAPSSEVRLAGDESKDRLYEPKHKQKLVRVLTVVAYIISVSLAAIVLSLYYMYIWDPSDQSHLLAKQKLANASVQANGTGAAAGLQAATTTLTICQEIGQAAAAAVVNDERLDGNSGDKAAPAFTTMETFNSAESSSPSQPSRSLYKILTTPAYRRNEDEASLSSDQPERFAPEQREDYQDGTIVPADAILDD